MFKNNYIDIYSASWGPKDNGQTMEAPGKLTSAALKKAVTKGRNGLGKEGERDRQTDRQRARGKIMSGMMISYYYIGFLVQIHLYSIFSLFRPSRFFPDGEDIECQDPQLDQRLPFQ